MAPFKILGLDRKADVPQIKRAYARLLRSHRPDEDPEGFQRLHEAYEACLQQARWREEGWDDEYEYEDDDEQELPGDAPGDAVPAMATAETGTPPADFALAASEAIEQHQDAGTEDTLDAGGFADELMLRMHADNAQQLQGWLRQHEALYSLDHKRALQWAVVDALESVAPDVAARHFAPLTEFFGLDSIAGVDGWLQQRLYEIQRRFGDVAEFQRVLQSHAGPRASWTDQSIARELLQPFSWLRRLCLILCPGLPGRAGALSRALHAADPASAAASLNQKARQFWERATDRSALRRERLAFMASRLALWTLALNATTTATNDDKHFPTEWAISFGSLFVLWLAYALVVIGVIRFRDYNQSRMQWDMFLLMTVGGLACGAVSIWFGGSGVLPFIVTTIFWLGGRHPGGEGWQMNQFVALLAGLSGFGLVFLLLNKVAGAAMPLRHQALVGVLYAFGSQAVHDWALAKARGIPLYSARVQTGWLWPMFGIHALLLVVVAALFG